MTNRIALKGDQDSLGYTIQSGCSPDVRINGQPVALKGSVMSDGVSIVSEVSTSVRVNGKFVARSGSQTEEHTHDPRGVGTIRASSDVSVGD